MSDTPRKRTALTRAEVWENAFTAWWIRYLKRRFGVGPNYRHMDPYAEAETAAIDAAASVGTMRRTRTISALLLRERSVSERDSLESDRSDFAS